MRTVDGFVSAGNGSTVVAAASADGERLRRLRARESDEPARARDEAWAWLCELTPKREHARLPWLFAQGRAPESPHGDCEGVVMGLEGAPWLFAVDTGVRLGQLLGGIGWTGKSFDAHAGTGYNRLTLTTWPVAKIVMPRYRFRRVGDELVGFPFHHALERSPVAPFHEVRAIRYDAPEHRNPLMLPRTRDELVEIVSNVYLGRALLREDGELRVIGYFGLRFPRGGVSR